MTSRIHPVILCGGSGKRLWPLSRNDMPKQFLALTSERSMFQETLLRLGLTSPEGKPRFAPPIIIANAAHADLAARQLAEIGIEPDALLLEPVGRNTAPAAAAAALWVQRSDPGGLILLLPADHFIADVAGFHRAIGVAETAARAGYIATFGITPTAPEIGYGYIEQGAPLVAAGGAYRVARFAEKPKLAEAERYIASGKYSWNSGMFFFKANVLLEEMERYCPAIPKAVTAALPAAATGRRVALDPHKFRDAPNEPIDIAVMEKTGKAAMVPASIGWSDVGSFAALWEAGERDSEGNFARGDAVFHGARGTYVHSSSRCVAAIGVEDLVIVETQDAVLVVKRESVQDIKSLVDKFESGGRQSLLNLQSSGASVTTVTLQAGESKDLRLGLKESAQIVVLKGELQVFGKRYSTGEATALPAGWAGRIAPAAGESADILLVVLQVASHV